MKNYIYSGTSNLVFSHEKADYAIHGPGPHQLPENSPVVKTNVERKKLTEVADQSSIKPPVTEK